LQGTELQGLELAVLVHHLSYLRHIRHVEYFLETQILPDQGPHIGEVCLLALLVWLDEALNQVFAQIFEPVIIDIHEVIIWYEKAVGEVVLETEDRIIHNDAVPQVPATLSPREEIEVFDLVALIVRRALLS
jgi:hypothetical protein